jgi:hypothetical protein
MRSRLHRRLLRRRSKLRNLTGWFSTLVYAPGRWFHRTGLHPTYQFFVTWRTTAMKRPNAAEAKPKDVKPGEALARLAAKVEAALRGLHEWARPIKRAKQATSTPRPILPTGTQRAPIRRRMGCRSFFASHRMLAQLTVETRAACPI